MASRTSEMVAKVDPAHALDQKALLAYASANVPGFPLHPSDFTVSQVLSISLLLFLSLSLCWFWSDFLVGFIVRARAIQSYVSDGSEIISGGFGETLRFEEEATGEVASVCSRRW